MSKGKNLKINAILNTIKTVSAVLFPLITFPYVSRVLQPENIGKVNFGNSIVSYFTLIATLGITTYAIRECSVVKSNKELLSRKASEIFSINICTTAIAYIALFITIFCFRDLDSYRTLIILQSTTILFTTLGADWLNSAMEDFFYITIRTIAFQVVSLCLMFLLVKEPSDYMMYAGITVFSVSGASLLNMYYRRRYCNVRFTINMHWLEHTKPIMLLFAMILAQTIFCSADVTMLGLMKGDYEVGIYSTATKITNIIAQVSSSLAWVVMPRMSEYFAEGDYEQINRLLKKVFGVLVLVGLPCTVGAMALSNEIVLIVGGMSYQEAALPLSITMLSFGFSILGGSFLGNMVLLPSKKEKTYMIICCIATAVNVVLNYFFIRIWGATAAATTTAFCSFLMMIMLIITKDKRIKLDYIFKSLVTPAIGSFFIFICCVLVRTLVTSLLLKTIVCVVASILLYVIILVLLKNEMFFELYGSIIGRIKNRV